MARRDVIAIGGSLGAVKAVMQLCRELPAELAATMFIVIHIGDQGNNQLADIFNAKSAISITTALDGEILEPGHAYVAPADHHLLIVDDRIRLGRGPRENMARPAIDPLFRSAGIAFGPRLIAVVLTGMLNDGAAGLADVKRCGGTTVVQNPSDALAPDMPRGALRASDVDYRAPLSEIAALLVNLAKEEAGPAVKIPEDIRTEVDIALGRRSDSRIMADIADPVPLSCPACGGVMSQMKNWPPLRFRCQVGHGYTAEALAAEQEGTVDEAVRVALRIMEERVVLTTKMASDARLAGMEAAATSYERRIDESRTYAEVLRRAAAVPNGKVEYAIDNGGQSGDGVPPHRGGGRRVLASSEPSEHHTGTTGATLYRLELTCPRCRQSAVMDAKQIMDDDGHPTKFEIAGSGSFWLDGEAPQTRADATVRCGCGNRFMI